MPEEKRNSDGLGIYLTGAASDGAAQADTSLSLGGFRSSTESRPLGGLVSNILAPIAVERLSGDNGEGSGTIKGDLNSQLFWTPPGGTEGSGVTIANGESKLLEGTDIDKSVRVKRESANAIDASMTVDCLSPFNSGFSGSNVSNANRIAGVTTYRAVMYRGHGAFGLLDIITWLGAMAGMQATIAIGLETAAADGSIQTIANETTAPAAVAFSSPTTEGAGLSIVSIDVNKNHGLWIRRVFPAAGTVALKETVEIRQSFFAA